MGQVGLASTKPNQNICRTERDRCNDRSRCGRAVRYGGGADMSTVVKALLAFLFCHSALGGVASATPIAMQNATATYSQPEYLTNTPGGFFVAQAIDGLLYDDLNGWAIGRPPYYGAAATQAESAVFQTTQNVGYTYGTALTFKMYFFHFNAGHNLGNFRFSVTTDDRSTYADGLSTNGNVAATWTVLHPSSATTDGSLSLGMDSDGSILASGDNPATSI